MLYCVLIYSFPGRPPRAGAKAADEYRQEPPGLINNPQKSGHHPPANRRSNKDQRQIPRSNRTRRIQETAGWHLQHELHPAIRPCDRLRRIRHPGYLLQPDRWSRGIRARLFERQRHLRIPPGFHKSARLRASTVPCHFPRESGHIDNCPLVRSFAEFRVSAPRLNSKFHSLFVH